MSTPALICVAYAFAAFALLAESGQSSRANCPGCRRRERSERPRTNPTGSETLALIRTELVLEDILAKLHLKSRPHRRTDFEVKLPEAVINSMLAEKRKLDETEVDSDYDIGGADDVIDTEFYGTKNQIYVFAKRS